MRALLLCLLLVGCGDGATGGGEASAGARLEAAAVGAGLVPDPARVTPVGSWARDTDRMCVVPASGGPDDLRVGVVLDYGDGNACVASGTARRRGERLDMAFGPCRMEARFDGERITLPAEPEAACAALCRGNASLSALAVDRIGTSAAEARTLRSPAGRLLCAD